MAEAYPVLVDEPLDRFVHRRAARLLVTLLIRTPITPNQVTLLAGLAGLASGAALIVGTGPWARLLAALLLFLSVALDCSDGQLARAKQMFSPIGPVLDGTADVVVTLAVFTGVTLAAAHGQASILWLGVFACLTTFLHCAVFDAEKGSFLHHHVPDFRLREQDAARIAPQRDAAWRDGKPATALLLLFYWLYLRDQARIRAWFRQRPPAPAAMRTWRWLGIGTRLLCLYAAMILSLVWPGALLAVLLLFAVPMNLLFLLLLIAPRPAA